MTDNIHAHRVLILDFGVLAILGKTEEAVLVAEGFEHGSEDDVVAFGFLDKEAGYRNIRVHLDIPKTLPAITSDRGQLRGLTGDRPRTQETTIVSRMGSSREHHGVGPSRPG